MRLGRNPVVVAGTFFLIFLLLLQARSTADSVVWAAVWIALVAMSVLGTLRALRRRAGEARGFGQDAAMPERIRRWVFDEPDPPSELPRPR